MTGAQPNPIDALTAETTSQPDVVAEQDAAANPEYVGDLPDDPEQARTYRPGNDQPDEDAR